jgi:hypothetical protein
MTALHYNPRRDLCQPGIGRDRDLSSRTGCTLLAAELNEWWAKRGYPHVQFHAVQRTNRHGHGNHEPLYGVVSNLLNGLPPKSAPVAAAPSRAATVVPTPAAVPTNAAAGVSKASCDGTLATTGETCNREPVVASLFSASSPGM